MSQSEIRNAVEAHTTLCLFENIAVMLESSDIKGSKARRTALKAVALLRHEQQFLLRDYDRAVAAMPPSPVTREAPPSPPQKDGEGE